MYVFFLAVSAEPPIRAAPCRVPDRWLLSPRLELYVDRLALTEWWGWRRVRCRLPLKALARVEAPRPEQLLLQTRESRADGTSLTIEVGQAAQWAHSIRAFQACLTDVD